MYYVDKFEALECQQIRSGCMCHSTGRKVWFLCWMLCWTVEEEF